MTTITLTPEDVIGYDEEKVRTSQKNSSGFNQNTDVLSQRVKSKDERITGSRSNGSN